MNTKMKMKNRDQSIRRVKWKMKIAKQTRPSSDSEAVTMYKLKGQSLNKRTGQGFKEN